MTNYAQGLPGVLATGAPADGTQRYRDSTRVTVPGNWQRPRELYRKLRAARPFALGWEPTTSVRIGDAPEVPVWVADTPDRLRAVVHHVWRQPALALDTESSDKRGIYTDAFRLRAIQLATPDSAVFIPVEQHEPAKLRALFVGGTSWLVHNAAFDLAVLDAKLAVSLDDTWPATVDSMLYAQLVQHPNTRAGDGSFPAKLKELTRKLVDPTYGEDKELRSVMRKGKFTWATIPTDQPDYIRYAALDPLITIAVLGHLLPAGRTADESLYEYEARIAWLMCRLARRGLGVDSVRADALLEQFETRHAQIVTLFDSYGLNSAAPDTHDNKRAFVTAMGSRGVELTKVTPKNGLPALDSNTLLDACLAAECTDDALYVAWTDLHQAGKYRTAYVDPFQAAAAGGGRVHPVIRTLGARTGRMSIADPPLQQLPRLGEVRACLCSDPGHVLIGADYAAVEMRVAAALSGDPTMRRLIAEGVDLHDTVARSLFGPSFTHEQRNVAKRPGFGRLYGAGAATVARQCRVPVEVAVRALDAFDALFPGVKRYARRVSREQDLVTFSGRRIRTDEARPHANINYYVQSTARDVFTLGGMRAAGAGLEPYLWLPVHDEWIVQAPDADAAEVAHVLEQAQTSALADVQFIATAKIIGQNWVKS
jgi:DNA polymerase-1